MRYEFGKNWSEYVAKPEDTVPPPASSLMLYESGDPVGFAHQQRPAIKRFGTGRDSHSGTDLFFSTTDNSDPNRNGRTYAVCLEVA